MITARPLVEADLAAVVDLLHADDERWFGEPVVSAAEVAGLWAGPGLDLGTDSEGWEEDGALVAFGTLDPRGGIETSVRADWAGAGLEDAILQRWEEEARRRGLATVRRDVPAADAETRARLAARGWAERRTGWLLELTADVAPVPGAPLDRAYAVRPLVEADVAAAYEVLRAAFAPYGPVRPYEEWRAVRLDRPDVTPEACRVAVCDDEVVGACLVEDPPETDPQAPAWVSLLGVRTEHRRRGLARALLVSTIDAARARGAGRVSLYTHEDTGARRLYESVGMRARHTLLECELDLDR